MRYPTNENQVRKLCLDDIDPVTNTFEVRRFQIRLAEKETFFQALKVLTLANVPTEPPRISLPRAKPNLEYAVPAISQELTTESGLRNFSRTPLSVYPISIDLCILFTGECTCLIMTRNEQNVPSQKLTTPALQMSSNCRQNHSNALSQVKDDEYIGVNVNKYTQSFQSLSTKPSQPAGISSSAPIENSKSVRTGSKSIAPMASTAPITSLNAQNPNLKPTSAIDYRPTELPEGYYPPVLNKEHSLAWKLTEPHLNSVKQRFQHKSTPLMLQPVSNALVPQGWSDTPSNDPIQHDRKLEGEKKSITADEIDTQLLLEKVAMRKTASTEDCKPQRDSTVASTSSQLDNTTSSQRHKRKQACTKCRAARRKCERDPMNPTDPCQRCSNEHVRCSLATELEGKNNTQKEKETTLSDKQKNEEEVLAQISQARKASLRSNANISLSHRSFSSEASNRPPKRKDHHNTPPTQSRKRSNNTESEVYIITHGLVNEVPIRSPNPKTSDDCEGNAQKSSRKPLHTNLPAHIRSDATTVTADPNDLDTRGCGPQRISSCNPKSKLSSDQPTYSEISEIPSETKNNATNNKASAQLPHTGKDQYNRVEDQKTPMLISSSKFEGGLFNSAFWRLDEVERTNMVDELLLHALHDDNFTELCKTLDLRLNFHLLKNKIFDL